MDASRPHFDIDIVYFSILITFHMYAVGGACGMSMSMRETSWHPKHLQGQEVKQPHISVRTKLLLDDLFFTTNEISFESIERVIQTWP